MKMKAKIERARQEIMKVASIVNNDNAEFYITVDDCILVNDRGLISENADGTSSVKVLHLPGALGGNYTFIQGPGWEKHPDDDMFRHVRAGLLPHNDTVYIDSSRTFVIVDFGLGACYGFTKATFENDPAVTVNADRLFNAYKTYLTETYKTADPLLSYAIGHWDCRLWG